jgi:hypothetical protein
MIWIIIAAIFVSSIALGWFWRIREEQKQANRIQKFDFVPAYIPRTIEKVEIELPTPPEFHQRKIAATKPYEIIRTPLVREVVTKPNTPRAIRNKENNNSLKWSE